MPKLFGRTELMLTEMKEFWKTLLVSGKINRKLDDEN